MQKYSQCLERLQRFRFDLILTDYDKMALAKKHIPETRKKLKSLCEDQLMMVDADAYEFYKWVS